MRPVEQSETFDAWTIAHLATGAAAKMMGISFPVFMGMCVAWEILEQANAAPFGLGSRRESWNNVLADIAASWIAYELVGE